jgi:hypothetical protein
MYCILDAIWSQILGKFVVVKKPQKSPISGADFCNT